MTYGHMIIVPQPPSQSSKDVGRFHVAASRPQVIITGQQGTLNNPRIFVKRRERSCCGLAKIPKSVAIATLRSKNCKLLNAVQPIVVKLESSPKLPTKKQIWRIE